VVTSADDATLAELTLADAAPKVLPGLRLENRRGDVHLERLELSRWNGETVLDARGQPGGLHRTDGSKAPGEVVSYDAAARALVVRDGSKETRVPIDQVDHLQFPRPADVGPRAVLVVYDDGTRLGGELLGVEKDALILKTPGIEGPNRRPLASVRSIHVRRAMSDASPSVAALPRLELDGVRLVGHLVDGQERDGASCLAWQPEGSTTASPLLPGTAGQILNKEPPPPAPSPPRPAIAAGGGVWAAQPGVFNARRVGVNGAAASGFLRGFAGVAGPGERPRSPSLFLRTGDVVPCEVTRIDENGITLRSP
jgi:hypothetical protein